MVGRDQRVRVLDLGLARGDFDDAARGEIAGTPRYMAPEQLAGATPTPAVDQYALALSLREALEARGEVPRWLGAIIARASAPKPEDRFASMDEVVRTLGRDPARVWRWRILGGVAVAATASAFVVGRAVKPEACSSAPAGLWTEAAQARIGAHIDGLGAFAAGERAALVEMLGKHQREWQAAHHDACLAHDRGALTTAFYERRLTCLARAESSLAATSEILEHATAATFPDARVAAGSLVDPRACARVDESLVPLPPPHLVPAVRVAETAVERARLIATAARPEARDVAAAARVSAESTGYAPVVARALLMEGRAQMLVNDERARSTLESAMRQGFAAHDDASAVEAFARLAFVVSREGVVVDGTTIVDAVAARLGPDGTFARLLLLNNLAAVKAATTDNQAAARPLLETAMKEWRPGESENDFELVSIPQNLALLVGDPARSLELLATAREITVRLLGTDHPRVIEIDRMRVLFLDLEHARTLNDDACARLARLFPELKANRADCEYQSAWLADEAGDAIAAAKHFGVVAELRTNPKRARIADAMVALAANQDPAKVAADIERDAAADAKAAAPFARAVAADAYIAAARAWHVRGDAVAERRCWDGARQLLEAVNRPAVARRLARARAAVADPPTP